MAKNFTGITDTGKQRNNNEDSFIADKLYGNIITACVIDGLGGYEGGEIAAALAKDAITKALQSPPQNVKQQLLQALNNAGKNIQEEKRNNSLLNHMACVATLAQVDMAANQFYYAHVGDTRLYLLRDQSLVKITGDQSFVGFLEDSGRIGEKEAMTHPKRNEINKALGFDSGMYSADYFESGSSPFLPGDTIMLCSDGLTDMITNAEMTEILNSSFTLEQKAQALIDAANNAGGNDNITVVLVQHDKRSSKNFIKKTFPEKKTVEWVDDSVATGENTLTIINKPQRSTLFTITVIALTVALGIIAWMLIANRAPEPKAVMPQPAIRKKNIAEQTLADSLQLSKQYEISVQQEAGKPIIISDTIFINRDSLLLHGNGLTFKADSFYKGPVFVFGDKCRYVLLDSIGFQNFTTAIITVNDVLRVQAVRFLNNKFTVLHQVKLADSTTIKGNNPVHPAKKDSTHINQP
jgi:serine/threonine protein phosphatase PrpC